MILSTVGSLVILSMARSLVLCCTGGLLMISSTAGSLVIYSVSRSLVIRCTGGLLLIHITDRVTSYMSDDMDICNK